MLNERFATIPEIVAATSTQYTSTTAATKVAEAKVNVPMKPTAGLTYRFKLAGTKSATNAAHTVTLLCGATTLMTLTADDATAVDWVAEFIVRFSSATVQKVMGTFLANTADPDVDYAAGAVDVSSGAELVPYITSGNASDTVTCEMCIVEKWVK